MFTQFAEWVSSGNLGKQLGALIVTDLCTSYNSGSETKTFLYTNSQQANPDPVITVIARIQLSHE